MIAAALLTYAAVKGVAQAAFPEPEDPVAVIRRVAAKFGMVATEITEDEFRRRIIAGQNRLGD